MHLLHVFWTEHKLAGHDALPLIWQVLSWPVAVSCGCLRAGMCRVDMVVCALQTVLLHTHLFPSQVVTCHAQLYRARVDYALHVPAVRSDHGSCALCHASSSVHTP